MTETKLFAIWLPDSPAGSLTGKASFARAWDAVKAALEPGHGDVFHPEVPNEVIVALWDEMWLYPEFTFLVLTEHTKRMREWIQENAYLKNHGWTEAEQIPMAPEQLHSFEDFTMRERCGYSEEPGESDDVDGVYCNAKQSDPEPFDNGRNRCLSWCCPVLREVTVAELRDLGENDRADEYADPDEDEEETYAEGWGVLESRPRYAYAANVWVGALVKTQNQADFCVTDLLAAPAEEYFVVVAPEESVDLENLDFGVDVHNALGKDGRHVYELTPHLGWVISVGTGKADYARALRDQATSNKVPFLFTGWCGNRTLDGQVWDQVPDLQTMKGGCDHE